jgi:dUTP pyrophosphatase
MLNVVDILKLKPSFEVEDPTFLPQPAHSGEDAGADLKAFIPVQAPEESTRLLEQVSNYLEENTDWPGVSNKLKACLWDRFESLEELVRDLRDCLKVPFQREVFVDGKKTHLLSLKELNRFVVIYPGETVLVSTGFKIALPTEGIAPFLPVYKIVPRSGLAIKHGVQVANSPGIVDAGYRDWVRVGLRNTSNNVHIFTHGARIAQGLYELVIDQSTWTSNQVIVDELPDAQRGAAGFGSTGVEH